MRKFKDLALNEQQKGKYEFDGEILSGAGEGMAQVVSQHAEEVFFIAIEARVRHVTCTEQRTQPLRDLLQRQVTA